MENGNQQHKSKTGMADVIIVASVLGAIVWIFRFLLGWLMEQAWFEVAWAKTWVRVVYRLSCLRAL